MSKTLVKTAKQQFEERLHELGLLEEWERQYSYGRIGKVLENGNIVVYIHSDGADGFHEYFYPPFEELRKDDKFCRECMDYFSLVGEDEFIANMVCWLVRGKTECPFAPTDVYYTAHDLRLPESHDFEDIYEDICEYAKRLLESEGLFYITSVCRSDLEMKGFNTSKITDDQMRSLAEKMADDYCDQLFHESLRTIADSMGLPKYEDEQKITPDQIDWEAYAKDLRSSIQNNKIWTMGYKGEGDNNPYSLQAEDLAEELVLVEQGDYETVFEWHEDNMEIFNDFLL